MTHVVPLSWLWVRVWLWASWGQSHSHFQRRCSDRLPSQERMHLVRAQALPCSALWCPGYSACTEAMSVKQCLVPLKRPTTCSEIPSGSSITELEACLSKNSVYSCLCQALTWVNKCMGNKLPWIPFTLFPQLLWGSQTRISQNAR